MELTYANDEQLSRSFMRFYPSASTADGESFVAAVRKAKYEKPTGVQMQCIPLGLACKDVIGIAKTGSGKTCAFVMPMLVYVLKQPPITKETAPEGPLALIMAPTRELVQQIEDEARKFAQELKIRVYSVVGGLSSATMGAGGAAFGIL